MSNEAQSYKLTTLSGGPSFMFIQQEMSFEDLFPVNVIFEKDLIILQQNEREIAIKRSQWKAFANHVLQIDNQVKEEYERTI